MRGENEEEMVGFASTVVYTGEPLMVGGASEEEVRV